MTTKQWLSRGRNIDKDIDVLLKTKRDARDRVLRITQNYDGDGAQASRDPHKFDHLIELENMIDEKIDELNDIKNEITTVLMQIQNRSQRTVMISYYVRMLTFEQIAVELDISFRRVMYIRKAAIITITGILKEMGVDVI